MIATVTLNLALDVTYAVAVVLAGSLPPGVGGSHRQAAVAAALS